MFRHLLIATLVTSAIPAMTFTEADKPQPVTSVDASQPYQLEITMQVDGENAYRRIAYSQTYRCTVTISEADALVTGTLSWSKTGGANPDSGEESVRSTPDLRSREASDRYAWDAEPLRLFLEAREDNPDHVWITPGGKPHLWHGGVPALPPRIYTQIGHCDGGGVFHGLELRHAIHSGQTIPVVRVRRYPDTSSYADPNDSVSLTSCTVTRL